MGLIMAYYFKCAECGKKETFAIKDYVNRAISTKLFEEIPEGKKQEYETVICKPCVSKKIRLKGNYILI
tara:strand:+ start:888 stop:1094 length:207 start_codon:yes stop_codon:yes gene_type:complete